MRTRREFLTDKETARLSKVLNSALLVAIVYWGWYVAIPMIALNVIFTVWDVEKT